MIFNKNAVLVFGCGILQQSIIGRAHKMGLYVVGIDPCEDAYCKDDVDTFEIVEGQDFDGTCAVVEKYGIDAIVTAATDKPLVMMARIAEKYGFPFFSVDTAKWSTDKFQMKQRFIEGGVPCAKGRLVKSVDETSDMAFPVIVKPRDNSGSRGVKLCRNQYELSESMAEALECSKLDSVLVEEFIEGQEYSIEGLHFGGKSEVIQFTEKKTTEFPYNVELGHKQPANLTDEQKSTIKEIIALIGYALHFENCPSHTELKINDRGIFVIETSPRLGGDFITSTLVPLSTGINMEDQLLYLALDKTYSIQTSRLEKAAGICFLQLPCGTVREIDPTFKEMSSWPNVKECSTSLDVGVVVQPITNSLNRYGQFVIGADNREELDRIMKSYEEKLYALITVY